MSVYVVDGTFEGDAYAKGLLEKFFTEFLQKYYEEEESREKVLDGLLSLRLSEVQKYERTRLLGDYSPVLLCEIEELLESVASFTHEWLNTHADYKKTFTDHYKDEWEDSVLGERNSYHIAQYNSMLLYTTLKTLIIGFVRKQIYQYYQDALSRTMEEVGQSVYICCMSSIDKYGLYDPNPVFTDKHGESVGVRILSTKQPDINILWSYFHKYKLIEFLEGKGEEYGYMVARYSINSNPESLLHSLNLLKYRHFNIGGSPRRMVLDIRNKQAEYLEDLESTKVTGNGRYWG